MDDFGSTDFAAQDQQREQEEARRRAEEEARRRAEEEARRKAELERKKAEEIARIRAEQEIARIQAEERQRKLEQNSGLGEQDELDLLFQPSTPEVVNEERGSNNSSYSDEEYTMDLNFDQEAGKNEKKRSKPQKR